MKLRTTLVARKAANTAITVLTELVTFTNFDRYDMVTLFLVNAGPQDVTMTVEMSQDGVTVDSDYRETVIPANKQGTIQLGPDVLQGYVRLLANSSNAAVKWSVTGTLLGA